MTAAPAPRPAAPTPPTPRAPDQHRVSTTLLALVTPLAILAVGALVAASWRAELPERVATHWSTSGPDGFSSLTALLLGSVLGAGTLTVIFWALAFRAGRTRPARQLAAGITVGVATLVAVLTVTTLAPQRGLADGADAGGVGLALTVSLLSSLALGLGAAALVPRSEPTEDSDRPRTDAPRIPLADDERAVWVRTTSSKTGMIIVGVAAAVMTAVVVAGSTWWMLFVPVVLVLLTVAMFSWTVTVDATGLTVRSALGFPRRHLPLDEIVDATVDDVVPFRDFGGYGWRTAIDGRTGIVMRAGETLEVRSTGERRFVVTVDDAATAAALLNSLADRRRAADA